MPSAGFSDYAHEQKSNYSLGQATDFKTMTRQLRQKEVVSYEISSESEIDEASAATDSPFGTPQKGDNTRKRSFIHLDEDSESDAMEMPTVPPPPRLSTAGHSLRQHNDLHQSLKAQENGDKPMRKKLKASRPTKPSKVISHIRQPPAKTARIQIRDMIANETVSKRNNFFLAHKDLFLPLLPSKNHVTKLIEQKNLEGQDDDILAVSDTFTSLNTHEMKDLSVPYEDLSQQPLGIKASMKPYQLSGLSFLLYLHRNGLSGILGDEMGLGKTLQTLSLIQYLKENGTQTAVSENRPSLVVCPLSVLSSWMAEARRWAPGLKVLRFHGPVHERARLKRIATGEIDAFGNETKRYKVKKNDRMTKAGKQVIDLDAEPDTENEVGVDLVVTTYECFTAEQSWFRSAFIWKYIILDEGHKIKNDQSQVAKSLQAIGAEYRLILTGTPLHNDMQELWALLHWLYPEVFTEMTRESFRDAFNLAKGTINTTFMDNARRLLERIMLRRMKNSEGVDLNLPPKTEVLLFMPLTPMQRWYYTRLMTRVDQGLLDELFHGAQEKEKTMQAQEDHEEKVWQERTEQLETLEKSGSYDAWQESKVILQQTIEQEQKDASKKSAWVKLMNLLMQLRKVCNHPYMIPHAQPEPYHVGEHVILASGKFIVLDKLIKELVFKQKKKILIFSEFTKMLDCCEDFLSLRGGNGDKFRYLRLEGSTPRARRNLCIRLFNQAASEHKVMLISTKAGGLGINLTAASDVVIMDHQWNPQITLQAEARAHRIGQNKPVTVYKLCTQGTVEEQMLGRIQKKLYLSAKVTESMQNVHGAEKVTKSGPRGRSAAADEDMPQLNTGQLMSLVRRGARALAHPELDVDDMLAWDWPTMLDKCKDRPADALVAKETGADSALRKEDEEQWLQQVERVHSRVFQGKKYSKQKDDYNSIAEEWSSRADRRIGKETTVMVDGFAISKQSMSCGDWEAVPTMAGKDPRLAEPKREKRPMINNQEHCQVCFDGGDLVLCSGCPRSYHYDCLDPNSKAKSQASISFNCSQHQCWDCEQKTADAGGMVYRCRWCERGFCEDCLDFDQTDLIGDNLKEYELLQYPSITQAYYICCPACTERHASNPADKAFCEEQIAEIDVKYQMLLDDQEQDEASNAAAVERAAQKSSMPTPSDTLSLTDASTIEDSAIATPCFGTDDGGGLSRKKRKAAPVSFPLDLVSQDHSDLAVSPCQPVEIRSSPSTRAKYLKVSTTPTKRKASKRSR